MANEQKSPNLASGSIIVASLAVAGSLFFTHEAPLLGSRPLLSEPQFHQSATSQDIEARLWQDPFAAVAKSLEKSSGSGDEQQCTDKQPPNSHCVSPLADIANAALKPLVIGVMLPGSPYAEDSEVRRRSRYAVLSGLDRVGFVPEDEHHIGYFRLPHAEQARLPAEVPYERFAQKSADPQQPPRRILLLWLNEEVLSGHPLQKIPRYLPICAKKTQRDLVQNAKMR
jgi:hypothetical protein